MRLQDIGCICCLQDGYPHVPVDVHHLVDNGYRKHSGGHDSTLPLCPYHHRGVITNGLSESETLFRIGPSLALHKKRFLETYGTERELLAEVDMLIDAMERAA
jgi:hypothetical protein